MNHLMISPGAFRMVLSMALAHGNLSIRCALFCTYHVYLATVRFAETIFMPDGHCSYVKYGGCIIL
jgi:hypothetical protein